MRRYLLIAALLVIGVVATPPAHAKVAVMRFEGKGWGHGVGLAQWGAESMARHGAGTPQILSTFYPGTQLSQKGGQVRVAVYSSPNNHAALSFPYGGELRSPLIGKQRSGFPVKVSPGGAVQVRFDGSYHVDPMVSGQSAGTAVVVDNEEGCVPFVNCGSSTTTTTSKPGGCTLLCATTTTTAPHPTTTTTRPVLGPPTTAKPSRTTTTTRPAQPTKAVSGEPVWSVPSGSAPTTSLDRGRSYRGLIQATAGAGPLRLINQVDIETYLKGMAEVPGGWPAAAVGAQAVVARTYALRAMSYSGELCDYDACQVYVGVGKESPGQNAAVDATRNQVLTYNGALASTVYSADAGGVSATTVEGFGTPAVYPYLTTVRYNANDSVIRWKTDIALTDIASRFGYRGTLKKVTISQRGPSGRALELALVGDKGTQKVEALEFKAKLGLRSTFFEASLGSAKKKPKAPKAEKTAAQVLPEDTKAMRFATMAGLAAETQDEAIVAGPKPAPDHASSRGAWPFVAALFIVAIGSIGARSHGFHLKRGIKSPQIVGVGGPDAQVASPSDDSDRGDNDNGRLGHAKELARRSRRVVVERFHRHVAEQGGETSLPPPVAPDRGDDPSGDDEG